MITFYIDFLKMSKTNEFIINLKHILNVIFLKKKVKELRIFVS